MAGLAEKDGISGAAFSEARELAGVGGIELDF
jgi:hypothetical protein